MEEKHVVRDIIDDDDEAITLVYKLFVNCKIQYAFRFFSILKVLFGLR